MAATVEELKVVLSAVTTKFRQQIQSAKKIVHEISDEAKQTADEATQAADNGAKAVVNKIGTTVKRAKAEVDSITDAVKATVSEAAQTADSGAKAVANAVGQQVDSIQAEVGSVADVAKQAASEAAQAVSAETNGIADKVGQQVQSINAEVGSVADTAKQTVTEVVQSVNSGTKQTAGSLEELSQKTGKTVSELRSEALKLGASYQKMGMGKSDAMKKAYRDIGLVKDEVKSTEKQVSSSSGKIKKILSSLVSSAKGKFKTLGTQADGLKSKLSSAFTAVKASALIIAVQKLTGVIKTCVDAYNTLASSQMGLDSILSAQGKSVSQAKKWLEEYTKDGLISTADAYSAYKNLSSAGYSDDQTQSIMQNLKDSSAFNRQASLSMGEAVKSATEGIKNENSVLVDNAGVTKNLSVIWKEYAASIGKSVDSLTAAEKRIATTEGLMRETAFQTGDAAKYANTLAGAMAALKAQTTSLSAAVGSAFAPILKAVIPIITSVTAKLTELFNAMARITTALFGSAGNTGVSQIASDATNATDSVNDTTAAVKELKRSTMGFDQLNILSDNSSDDTSSGDTQTSVASIATDVSIDDSSVTSETDSIIAKIKSIFSGFKVPSFDFSLLFASWKRLKQGAADLGKSIWNSLQGVWNNLLVPFAEWTVNKALPATLGVLGSAFSALGAFIDGIRPGLEWVWNSFLVPVGNWTGGVIISALQGLQSVLDNIAAFMSEHKTLMESIGIIIAGIATAIVTVKAAVAAYTAVQTICNVVMMANPALLVVAAIGALVGIILVCVKNCGDLTAAFENFKNGCKVIVDAVVSAFNTYLMPVIQNIAQGFSDMYENHIKPFVDSFLSAFNKLITCVSALWNFLSPFLAWILESLIKGISISLQNIWNIVAPVINGILDVLRYLLDALGGLLDFLTGVFTGDWNKAWNGIKALFLGVWNAIKASFRTVLDIFAPVGEFFGTLFATAVAGIKNVWNGITGFFSGIWNGIKGAFGNVADWFKNVFTRAWNGVKNVFSTGGKIFSGITTGISNVFKNIVNKIIGGINNVISVPFKAINTMLKKLKSINILGVAPFGWVTEFKIPQIPMLAKGGIVDSPTAAVIGDAGKEAVMPLEHNTGWIDSLAARISSSLGISENSLYRAFARALAELPDEEILLLLDSEIVARASEKGRKKLNRRYGKVEVGT